MTILLWAVILISMSALLLPATWVVYLAIMNLMRVRDTVGLSIAAERCGKALLYFGLFLDFLCNVLTCTLIFRDIPRDFLVTSRLQRYVDGPEGWRKDRAIWWAENMLDSFDPTGSHIKRNTNDN